MFTRKHNEEDFNTTYGESHKTVIPGDFTRVHYCYAYFGMSPV